LRHWKQAQQKGLDPDDYDAARWPRRLQQLAATPGDAAVVARFDAALTVNAMRYISNLHIGRVNPRHFHFGINIASKEYDLPQFLQQQLIHAASVSAVLQSVELNYPGYLRTEQALQHYLQLEQAGDGPRLPSVAHSVHPGQVYAGTAALEQRLLLLGDLPKPVSLSGNHVYDEALAHGVEHFQARHGLAADGILGRRTLHALNLPVARRVQQLQDALERWRWMPPDFSPPPVVVNIPEFVLRAYRTRYQLALKMNVVVGRALETQTPIFTASIERIVFRPYWDVPLSITRSEIVPELVKNRDYLHEKRFEIITRQGAPVEDAVADSQVLEDLRRGSLEVRQLPGPENALGLVKFIFPNSHSVYLHGTPATRLFTHSRRDFSHGCIRVEHPAELAAFLLRKQRPWSLPAVRAAMQTGPDDSPVALRPPVPVLILYVTAVVQSDGSVHFFDDIYGFDRKLNAVLARGMPYPTG
jgi:murein L,D-transpeptidase YcbB/YkuD